MESLEEGLTVRKACSLLGINIGMFYKWKNTPEQEDRRLNGPSTRPYARGIPRRQDIAITAEEREAIIGHLKMPEYAHLSVKALHRTLLSQRIFVASESTYHRVARAAKLTRARRRRIRAESEVARSLKRRTNHVVVAPNQVWMWDISYFKYLGTKRHVYLFLAEDLYSRKIVGARFYEAQTAENAVDFFKKVFEENGITSDSNLKIHSDNGSAMRSELTVNLFKSKCVELDTSRPLKSNDNPYVESLFGTLKGPFDFKVDHCKTLEHCNRELERVVKSYNESRPHSGINYVPPEIRHQGKDSELAYLEVCRETQLKHFHEHPERYLNKKMRNYEPAGAQVLNPSADQIIDGLAAEPTNLTLLRWATKMKEHHIGKDVLN